MRKAEINLDSLLHNANTIRLLRPHQKILAYVKSNAYGHGLSAIVSTLNQAVDGYGVVGLHEGLKCRELTSLPVVVNASESDHKTFIAMAANKLDPVIYSIDYLDKLLAESLCWPRVWLKINSGMNRMGLAVSEVVSAFERLSQSGKVQSIIAMTHLADSNMSPENKQQLNIFRKVVNKHSFSSSSYANSAAILESNDHCHGEWIRPGLLLYGWTPELQQTKLIDIKPVMSVFSQILSINNLKAGSSVGYGRCYISNEAHQTAIVSMGYGDGIPRQVKAAKVIVRGEAFDIIGLPSMDTVCIRIDDQKVKVGDWVQWFGAEYNLHHLAQSSQTIPYEILTRISGRVERIYVKEYDKIKG